MARYAVMKEDYVLNIIEAEENAFDILPMLIPEATEFVLISDEDGAYPGGDRINGRFRAPKPYKSWIWDENAWSWTSPIPYPEDSLNAYTWNEDLNQWEILERPINFPIFITTVNEDGSESQSFIIEDDT